MIGLPHLGSDTSHLYQAICLGVKPTAVVKEHGITTQSPASTVTSPSLRVTQYPLTQCCRPQAEAPINAREI